MHNASFCFEVSIYDNNLGAFNPQLWARESVALLHEHFIAPSLVNRSFEENFAKFGETVHTRKPADFVAVNKGNNDDVTDQAANADDIAITLNQHPHVSFLIRDGEETKSFVDLRAEYIEPAAIALARRADKIVLGQVYQFLENQAGALGGLTDANGVAYITAVRKVQELNLAHAEGRRLVVSPNAAALFLQNPVFHSAEKIGDEGTALREASLGRKFGYDMYEAQNVSSVSSDGTLGSGAINNSPGGYPVGATVLTVNGFGASEIVPGQWITIGGRPYHVIATNNATATEITLEYGLTAAAAHAAPIVVYDAATVNRDPGGYSAGYVKEIVIDGVAGGSLSPGQMVTFGTQTHRYAVTQTNGTTSMYLDRPLEADIANDLAVNFGPTGDYNFAFHRNAMTLAIRPLKLPESKLVVAGMASFGGVTIRVVITYDGLKQGHRVTLDFLCGVKILDRDLGAVLLS